MPWVKFNANYDFASSARSFVAYKAGNSYLVSQACADAAIKAGKAENVERPVEAPPVGRRRRGEDAGG